MWKAILKKNFTRLALLLDFLELSKKQKDSFLEKTSFPLFLPLRLAQKIEKGNPRDPILHQFVPSKEEALAKKGFCQDPLKEKSVCQGRMLQKYCKRALLLSSSSCAMHCRFCFRRHFSFPASSLEEEVEKIRKDRSLSEIILSGNDPLSLANEELKKLFSSLDLPHIRRLRIHTRFPIGIPERIDEGLLAALKQWKKPLYIVLHINHPNELDDHLLQKLKKMQDLGISILSQSVLLKGVNDQIKTLIHLYETLIDHSILPYYIHQLDHVAGTSHFEVDLKKGKRLFNELKNHLPGYGVPRFVKEISGKKSKEPIF